VPHRLLVSLIIAATLPPPAAKAQAEADVMTMRIAAVAPSIYVISGFTNGNIVALVGSKGVMLVDGQSGRRVGLADSALRTVTKLPVQLVVNTHYHADHIEGNPHWRAQGARIFAQRLLVGEAKKDTVITEWEEWHREAADPAALPDSVFDDSIALPFEGHVTALHADSAHTSGDAVIWFRDANVIHTGDIVELGAPPFLDWWGGGTLDGMIRGVDLVLAHADDKTRIVPGHGWVTNRAEVATYRKMLVTMRERTLAAIGAGQSAEQYLATQPTREFNQAFGGSRYGERFARLLYVGLSRRSR